MHRMALHSSAGHSRAQHGIAKQLGLSIGNSGFSEVFSLQMQCSAWQRTAEQSMAAQSNSDRAFYESHFRSVFTSNAPHGTAQHGRAKHRNAGHRKAYRIGLRQLSHFRSVFHFKCIAAQGKARQGKAKQSSASQSNSARSNPCQVVLTYWTGNRQPFY